MHCGAGEGGAAAIMNVRSGEVGGDSRKRALQLILLFGIISLLGDIIYEGARGVNGPYLATLGASAAMVGLVAGLGEFLGYAVRLASGYFADRTGAYWFFTFLGYGLLVSVPLLGLAGVWQVAAVFIICERFGKALRSPAKDTILSQATSRVGRGFGFGLHEAMDQIGAIAGPLVFTVIFALRGGYRQGYTLLWIPFILLIAVLVAARIIVPSPDTLEAEEGKPADPRNNLSKVFWLYTAFSSLAVLGFSNFSVIAFHLKVKNVMTDAQIPLFYSIAMGVDAVAALVVGRLYDRIGMKTLLLIPLLTACIPFLAFTESFHAVAAGMVLWGVVMAIHETIMRAAIADLTSIKKRGTGYGIFNTAYGLSMFLGSFIMGALYEAGTGYIMVLALAAQTAALPLYFVMMRAHGRRGAGA